MVSKNYKYKFLKGDYYERSVPKNRNRPYSQRLHSFRDHSSNLDHRPDNNRHGDPEKMGEMIQMNKSIIGSAKGTVIANSKKEAEEKIMSGQWDDIDIDVEDIINIEHLKKQK